MRALRGVFVLVLALALSAPMTATVAHTGTDYRDLADDDNGPPAGTA